MQSKEFKRTIRLYQAFQVFISAFFWLPIYYSYQKLHGLGDAEYFEIQSFYYLIFCLLEIPTGYFSDRFGHKRTLVLSSFVLAISNLSAILWTTYLGFLIHFVLIAMSRSLASGAASAYLYEFLHREGDTSIYKKVEGKARSYALYLRTAGWGLAGYAMAWHPTLPYWATFGCCLFALAATVLLPSSLEKAVDKNISNNLVSVVNMLKGSSVLFYLMFLGAGVFVLSRLSQVNLYQPIMERKGFELGAFGLLLGVMTLFEAYGANQAYRVAGKFSELVATYVATLTVGLGLLIVVFAPVKPVVIVGFLIFSLGAGVSFPLLRQLLNDAIPDGRYRATVLSVESIFSRLICGGAALGAGHFVAKGELWSFLAVSILALMGLVSVLVLRIQRGN